MLVSLPLVVYLLLASFSLNVLAFFLYCHGRQSPELRVTALVMLSAGAASLALASLVWMEISLAAKTAAQVPAQAYAESAEGDSGRFLEKNIPYSSN
jgi:hypothetical protein